jgi:hypothetical protein
MEDIMKTNESAADRIIRVVLGLALISLVLFKVVAGVAAIVVGIAGGVILLTGLVGFCAIYALFGLSTHKATKNN